MDVISKGMRNEDSGHEFSPPEITCIQRDNIEFWYDKGCTVSCLALPHKFPPLPIPVGDPCSHPQSLPSVLLTRNKEALLLVVS